MIGLMKLMFFTPRLMKKLFLSKKSCSTDWVWILMRKVKYQIFRGIKHDRGYTSELMTAGMENDVIQRKIDEVIEITCCRISRVFLASDGNPSDNDRHHVFMNFWEPIYEQRGLARVLTELKGYRRILPLSDMLHLGKNL
jgi:hypothetical protein